jgi:RNA polymerase sigma-70 factor (ECF subfamily)
MSIPVIILSIENDDDREFMVSVYTEFYPMMKATALKTVRNENSAEDIVQDVIENLIQKLRDIRSYERYRLLSYVRKAVQNASLNHNDKHNRESRLIMHVDCEAILDDTLPVPEIIELQLEYDELGRIIKQLPERERDLLYLKYNNQYDDETIGIIMGIKKDSVRQYLTRARRMAKERILKEGGKAEKV